VSQRLRRVSQRLRRVSQRLRRVSQRLRRVSQRLRRVSQRLRREERMRKLPGIAMKGQPPLKPQPRLLAPGLQSALRRGTHHPGGQ